jgi:hypothetical protein
LRSRLLLRLGNACLTVSRGAVLVAVEFAGERRKLSAAARLARGAAALLDGDGGEDVVAASLAYLTARGPASLLNGTVNCGRGTK